MTRTEALAAIKQHGSLRAASRATGLHRHTIKRLLNGQPVKAAPQAAPPATGKPRRTIADFRSVYDKSFVVPQRIRESFKRLGAGWCYEMELVKDAGISLVDLRTFSEAFTAHFVHIPRERKTVWCGSPATANKLRAMLTA